MLTSSTETVEDGLDDDTAIKKQSEDLASTFTYATIGIIAFILLICVVGYIDARCIRVNDYFNVMSIVTAGLQLLDTVSDCFFAVEISIKATENDTYYIALGFAIIFIVLPTIMSLLQLYRHLGKHWSTNDADDRLRFYLTTYTRPLLLISMIFGSSFTAISLLNSNLFNLPIFNMNLTKQQLKKFGTKRVYSVILFEVKLKDDLFHFLLKNTCF